MPEGTPSLSRIHTHRRPVASPSRARAEAFYFRSQGALCLRAEPGVAKLYDLLMDVGFNSAARKLRGNKAATVIAVKNLGRCFALVVRPPFVLPL